MSLLAAKELGVSVSRIRYRRASTSTVPDSGTTVASRGTIMGGGAVTMAARELKQKMAEVVCETLQCPAQDVRFRTTSFCSNGRTLSFEDSIRAMFQAQQFPYVCGVFKAPRTSWDEHTGGRGDAYFTWVYGCQAAELTVNKKTGKVKLLGGHSGS